MANDTATIHRLENDKRQLLAKIHSLQTKLHSVQEDKNHFAECYYVEQQGGLRLRDMLADARARCMQLEKEAAWLADQIVKDDNACVEGLNISDGCKKPCTCATCFREAARMAVQND